MAEEDPEKTKDKLSLIIGDDEKALELIEAAKNSMGVEINELDLLNIVNFTRKIKSLIQLRTRLHE